MPSDAALLQGPTTRDSVPRRAAIYCRISQDTTREGLGVTRQEEDCRRLVTSRGWTVADVYIDNDVSAYKGKRRPDYERMMGDVAAGLIDAVVAWHPDRLHRAPIELEQFIQVVEVSGSAVATVMAGEYDLASASGRMTARIIGAVARGESEHKSDRIQRKMRELADNGKPSGQARTFGYDRPRDSDGRPIRGSRPEVVPAEAERIREASRRVLGGESLYAILRDWTAEGVPTVRGAEWSTTALSTILTSPRIAGLRVHRGDVVGQADWEAIIDQATWSKVVAILTDPARKRTRPKRSYLLTGMLRCGLCGHQLVATPRRAKAGGGKRGVTVYERGATQRVYGCIKRNGGCGSVFILAEPVEDFVSEAVLRRLDGSRLQRVRTRLERGNSDDARLLDQIAKDEAAVAELSRGFFVDNRISRVAYTAASEPLEARLRDARGRLASRPRGAALEPLSDVRSEWNGLSLDRKRAVIGTLLSDVCIGPATGPRNRFDPERIQFPPGCWNA